MNREELRDQLLAPVLKWTRLGRQTNQLMTASSAVISYRSRRLMRALVRPRQADWTELTLMTREKMEVPLESAAVMVSVMAPAAQRCWTHAGQSMLACTSDTLSLAGSRSPAEFSERQAALSTTLINATVGWLQLWGTAAEIAGQGLTPVLRQVQSNAERLGKR